MLGTIEPLAADLLTCLESDIRKVDEFKPPAVILFLENINRDYD